MNQVIKVRIELTANHMGYFEFRVCPNNAPKKPASQMCLDKNILQQSNSGGPRYYPGPGSKVFEMHYQLPKDLTCQQCVFQWRYVAGNNWGKKPFKVHPQKNSQRTFACLHYIPELFITTAVENGAKSRTSDILAYPSFPNSNGFLDVVQGVPTSLEREKMFANEANYV